MTSSLEQRYRVDSGGRRRCGIDRGCYRYSSLGARSYPHSCPFARLQLLDRPKGVMHVVMDQDRCVLDVLVDASTFG